MSALEILAVAISFLGIWLTAGLNGEMTLLAVMGYRRWRQAQA
jgi:hypothetical protein